MQSANCTPGLTEPRLPTSPSRSRLLLDHAASHKDLAEDALPTPKPSKAQRRQGLHRPPPGEEREDRLNPELYPQGKPLCPAPPVRLDLIVPAAGHPRGRTPPYPPELPPMERCWALLQQSGAARWEYTRAGLKTRGEAGVDQVTPAVCHSLIQKVRDQEDPYGVEDEEDDDREL
jgi:hypothetical protein